MERRRRLADLLAVPASELLAHMLEDYDFDGEDYDFDGGLDCRGSPRVSSGK
jgi:hypothetical protein